MQKTAHWYSFLYGKPCALTKMIPVTKLTFFLLTAAFIQVRATGLGQVITLSGKDLPLKAVFTAIERQTGYVVCGNITLLNNSKPVSFSVKSMPLETFLQLTMKDQPFTYELSDKMIILSQKVVTESGKDPIIGNWAFTISGHVVDTLGNPLAGASIKITPGNKGGTSGADGMFTIYNISPGKYRVEISMIGHESVVRNLEVKGEVSLNLGDVQLRVLSDALKNVEIVSTGMFDRNKETFTGVTRTFSGKDLRTASRQNILEGLNLLDPSFKIIRDNNMGSDPNQLPKVEIRGSRSMPPPIPAKYSQQLKLEYELDPNQPLFILDGFETSLATIVNLDVNRIASVTLLKDAASTALYGSRSANGVVVIQTIQPTAGKVMISYVGTTTVTMSDLSGYNMMDSKELLKFQELSSEGPNAPGPFVVTPYDALLPKLKQAFRQNAVQQGVNTNWMKVPLQNSVSQNHNLSFTGGDEYFTYLAGISRNSNVGVMRGSDNKSTSGYLNLNYRAGKINVANNFTIAVNQQHGSPYGSFSDYVKIPPYYVVDQNVRYLEEHTAEYYDPAFGATMTSSFSYANPLYNANLIYKNSLDGLTITNNTMANWDLFTFLRLSGNFQYSKQMSQSDYFISPLNTQFDNVETSRKGSYNYNKNGSEGYSGNLTLTYNNIFAKKHILNANLRSGFTQRTDESLSLSALGFSATSQPLIYLANSYLPDSRPGGSTSKKTSMELTASLNYSYNMKYNLDMSYNLSGTSNFGSDNPYQTFYSFGLGWNISRERFLKGVKWVNQLSLTANAGLTGNQNAGNFGSRSTYLLNNDPTFFGEAISLQGIGNPDLKWTKTYNLTYNLSGRFFNNALSAVLSVYQNLTDPLITTIPVPPSLGITNGLPQNIGKLTTVGAEVILDARLAKTKNWTVNLGFNSPVYYKSEYSGLSNALNKFNDLARTNGYLQRYIDGSSPDDIYAVRSVGIGQARGYEVFLDKDGNYTYVFDKNNEVIVGSSRPKFQGAFNVRTRYRRFTVAVYASYVVGETKFNNALYNKVENLTVLGRGTEDNQDRRALYVRWKQPGDDASFLGIANSTLGLSSRFLQKENSLTVSNITFNYDVLDQYSTGIKSYIRKKLGLQAFGFSVNTTNIFQFKLTNIERERGLDYPFNRSVSLNLNVTF